MQTRLLVLGFRRNLLQAIEKRKIPYVLWTTKRYKLKGCAPEDYVVGDFSSDPKKIKKLLRAHKIKKISHTIASTEDSVVCAYYTRRALKARLNSKALVKRCTDKLIMKDFLKNAGIPMTKYVAAKKKVSVKQLAKKLELPIVVKDRKNSGGRGTVITSDIEVIKENLKANRLIEKFIKAPEASIESFIHNRNIQFTNVTQYFKKGETNIVPANFKNKEIQQLLALNQRVIEALNIKWGMTHLEVYRSKEGPLFGEIALRPPGGYIMDLITLAYGFNAWEAFLDVEVGNKPRTKSLAKLNCAAIVFHPGQGKVTNIKGWKKVSSKKTTHRHSLKVKEGDILRPRSSVSEEIGHLILKADNYSELKTALKSIDKNFIVTLENDSKDKD